MTQAALAIDLRVATDHPRPTLAIMIQLPFQTKRKMAVRILR